MGAVTVLAEALAHGGRVLWDSSHRPRLLLPKALRERLEPERETIREVLRRAAIFREQARTPGPLPILALLEAPLNEPGCISCGAPVEPRRFRCEVCALAVALALDVRPPRAPA